MNCESMVYLNKVFTNVEASSCPLLGELIASGETFQQQLSFFDPANENGCGCNNTCGCGCTTPLDLDEDLNFVIESTQVFVNSFQLADPADLLPSDVTVDGIPVDALEFFNERFMASTNALMSQISDCDCMEKNASTKAMFLIRNAGDWQAKVTIVITGSVFGCGGCKKFKLIMSTRDGVSIDIPGTSTFAVSPVCLPCTVSGIAPVINFSFTATASLLNPVITIDTGAGCNVILTGVLVTEPAAEVQVTRQTLFHLDAEAVSQPCDDLARCRQFPGRCVCEEAADETAASTSILNRCCDDADCSPDKNHEGCDDCDRPRNGSRSRQICCQFNGNNGCSF